MSQRIATAMSARNQISALSREVIGLLVKAMTEATTSSGANGAQGQTLLTSIEDAIFEIDSNPSEIQESESLLASDEPTVFASGILPVRQQNGKLQRIRALRSTLYGPSPTEPGAIEALKTLLNEWD
jgi:hypothetical protein